MHHLTLVHSRFRFEESQINANQVHFLTALAAIAFLVGLGLVQSEPQNVTFGELRTFKDLAKALANG